MSNGAKNAISTSNGTSALHTAWWPIWTRFFILMDRGVARAGFKVFSGEKHVGYVTSGTTVPYLKSGEKGIRSIGLAIVDGMLRRNTAVDIEIRGERKRAVLG